MRSLAEIRHDQHRSRTGAGAAISVMVVDDSLTARTAIVRMIDSADDITVTATAASAETAIRQLGETPVDVILLDLEMPGMGGLEALPKLIETASQAQILVVSALTQQGAEHTLAALSMGAADTMLKPRSGGFTPAYRDDLVDRIRALGRRSYPAQRISAACHTGIAKRFGKQPRMIAVGASTGGIHALSQLLKNLPAGLSLPIVITQHLPESFVPVLARQIEMFAIRQTHVAKNGMPVTPGCIFLAPGNAHINIRSRRGQLEIKLSHERVESGCIPSVDPMLASIADACSGEALGIVLSGMGRDGVIGAGQLVDAGGTIFAQDEASSAVWGMPRAVCEQDLAAEIASPQELAGKILQLAGVASWT
ncbi:chemotaxis-specific protein-glutamate methyltransferase CheB [Altererythrobacter sp. MF3-039]|uniref:chemotaxis-specific protein-glutamate methyltransferase CheB n=1 Tax=Altererythrobacter sp. MF3-039 TaxID=3252901 RepID=UPI00390C8C8C